MKFTFKIFKLSDKASSGKVYYDTYCSLCCRMIRFLAKLNTDDNLEFVPIQYSEFVADELKTIILVENNKVYRKSDAVIRIAKHLKSPLSWLYVFKIVPRYIRDWIYDIIARNRYNWFGRCDSCSTDFQRM